MTDTAITTRSTRANHIDAILEYYSSGAITTGTFKSLDDAVKRRDELKSKGKKAHYRFLLNHTDVNWDDLVKTLHDAYIKYTGDTETKLMTIGGGTYSRALSKAVAFGPAMPGREDVAHQVDEHIYVEDLLKGTAIYMEAIYQLTK